MVTPENNNKFYIMTKLSTDDWEAQWGRVEGDLHNINQSKSRRKTYPMHKWDSMYHSKTRKGYDDVSHLYEEKLVIDNDDDDDDGLTGISEATVRQLVESLQSYASSSVKRNYTISSKSVTQAMVDEAQKTLDEISKSIKRNGDLHYVNEQLLKLFRIIPRKMRKVQDNLIESLSTKDDVTEAQKSISDEQDTLDVMAGQVNINMIKQDASKTKSTTKQVQVSILDQLGLEIVPAAKNEIAEIKKFMQTNSSKLKSAFKVVNKKTQDKYNKHLAGYSTKNEELFWHGSRNQNWFNILQTGLLIRPTGAVHTGSMFGDGIYFANKAQKSIGYSSLRGSYWSGGADNKGYLALFRTNVGNQKHIKRHDSSCYSLSQSKIEKQGYDSVYAHGGIDLRNDEFIIYKADKCTVEYLVEIGN